jgi:glycosyltransferase involved in cell wall biosynthesis
MKLLFILPEFGASFRQGIATFYNHLLPGLLSAGCSIDVCLPWEQEIPSDLKGQTAIRIICVDANKVEEARASLRQFSRLPELQQQLAHAFAAFETCGEGQGYDVVEATDYRFLYVPWLIKVGGPPIVVQLHSSNGQLDYYEPREGHVLSGLTARLLETSLLDRADELQSYGPPNAAEWGSLLNKEVCHIWPAWHQEEIKATSDIPPELNASEHGVVVARVRGWKGPEVLCQATKLLGDAAPKILWIGADHKARPNGESMSMYLKRAYGEVWEKAILPVGEMSREMTAAIQASAKFVVIPSIWDTFNLAAVEAMAASKVVICSDGAGVSRLIQDGENGFRFPANDPKRLAAVLAEVGKLPPSERTKIGERARETVARELNPDRICAARIVRYQRLRNSKIPVRQEHPWVNSLFGADVTESPFAYLNGTPTRQLVKCTVQRALRRIKLAFPHS